jgi:hypothetical protein
MALWGNKDSFASLTGTVTVDYANKIITGSGTTFVTAGISTGDVISIGVGNTFGEAVVAGVTSATQISIASTQFLSGAAISGIAYTVSQKPLYTLGDSNWGASEIYGVDSVEVGLARTTAFAVTHEGWVGLTTYTDTHGRVRVKHEVLVAGGILTTFDAEDDAKFPE